MMVVMRDSLSRGVWDRKVLARGSGLPSFERHGQTRVRKGTDYAPEVGRGQHHNMEVTWGEGGRSLVTEMALLLRDLPQE